MWQRWHSSYDVVRTADGSRKQEGMMIVATTGTIAGQRIVSTIGQVFGLAIRTRGIAGNIMAGLASLPASDVSDGDTMTEYVHELVAARDTAIARLVTRAESMGANAVIDLRFDSAPVAHEMSEIVAYGTAVVTEPAS
jgi:uncharacterized protein YbjQ (UPF0145 family)